MSVKLTFGLIRAGWQRSGLLISSVDRESRRMVVIFIPLVSIIHHPTFLLDRAPVCSSLDPSCRNYTLWRAIFGDFNFSYRYMSISATPRLLLTHSEPDSMIRSISAIGVPQRKPPSLAGHPMTSSPGTPTLITVPNTYPHNVPPACEHLTYLSTMSSAISSPDGHYAPKALPTLRSC